MQLILTFYSLLGVSFQRSNVVDVQMVDERTFYSLLGVSGSQKESQQLLMTIGTFYSLLGVSHRSPDQCPCSYIYELSFYSLLGVSIYVESKNTAHLSIQLYFLLPFGSFRIKKNKKGVELRLLLVFLLPFGSFLQRLGMQSGLRSLLSTPFWEFQQMQLVEMHIPKALQLSTPFWEFRLTVSYNQVSECFMSMLSTPFWEFLFLVLFKYFIGFSIKIFMKIIRTQLCLLCSLVLVF